jgi:hypothetical protein
VLTAGTRPVTTYDYGVNVWLVLLLCLQGCSQLWSDALPPGLCTHLGGTHGSVQPLTGVRDSGTRGGLLTYLFTYLLGLAKHPADKKLNASTFFLRACTDYNTRRVC